jgi:hypothetical protein
MIENASHLLPADGGILRKKLLYVFVLPQAVKQVPERHIGSLDREVEIDGLDRFAVPPVGQRKVLNIVGGTPPALQGVNEFVDGLPQFIG